VAGNCRMCLVQVEKSPKLVASCSVTVMDGMSVFTKTGVVRRAREAVIEFLLINHPLDCPICDQGGECDLQDQAMSFGSDRGRFEGIKRSVTNKECGPLIKTIMNRCIHCTRCVRFPSEFTGVSELGTMGRGTMTEISGYVEKSMDSEVSANIIDPCPVGALTSKPYAFRGRPWERSPKKPVDILDGVGSHIFFDHFGTNVRVLPRFNEDINQEWISDKTRFAYDGLYSQRMESPILRTGSNTEYVSWDDALRSVSKMITSTHSRYVNGETKLTDMHTLSGPLGDVDAVSSLRDLTHEIGTSNLGSASPFSADIRSNYTFNSGINCIDSADVCVLVGSNPRLEGSMINPRIMQAQRQGEVKLAYIGSTADLTYGVEHIGHGIETLISMAEGRHRILLTEEFITSVNRDG